MRVGYILLYVMHLGKIPYSFGKKELSVTNN